MWTGRPEEIEISRCADKLSVECSERSWAAEQRAQHTRNQTRRGNGHAACRRRGEDIRTRRDDGYGIRKAEARDIRIEQIAGEENRIRGIDVHRAIQVNAA